MRAGALRRALAFALGDFAAFIFAGGFRLVDVVAMASPCVERANHPRQERITADSGAQVLAPVKGCYRAPDRVLSVEH